MESPAGVVMEVGKEAHLEQEKEEVVVLVEVEEEGTVESGTRCCARRREVRGTARWNLSCH